MIDSLPDDPKPAKAARDKKPQTPKSPKKAAVPSDQPLELRWNLNELPTSQHRAGLAGLVMCIRFLERKRGLEGVCIIKEVDNSHLVISVDRAGMQNLFDDIYAAKLVETASKTKWDEEPKRVDEIEIVVEESPKKSKPAKSKGKSEVVGDETLKKTKKEKRFIYDRVVPEGALIAELDAADSEDTKLWLKVWRDLVWSILRGVPAQREPYNARAHKRSIDDGGEEWDVLASQPDNTVELPSTYSLGAQAKNAENVSFEDVARLRFLLHFWAFVVAIYVPATLTREGTRDFTGFALAIPDVARLEDFVAAWEGVARARGIEASGYRPREAVIDLAAEAGLDVVRRSNERIVATQGNLSTHYWLSGVDVFHLEKDKNNVRMRGISRVVPERQTDDEYAIVRGANYWSSLFRRQRIINILERRRWWVGFARLCSITPDEMTIRHSQFQHDCRIAFTEVEMTQNVSDADQTLEHLIYKRIQAYVLGKVEAKHQLTWKTAQAAGREDDFAKYKGKVVRDAFLAVRSRTGADFIAYFTSTICSIPHNVSETKYLEVARALMNPEEVERVRSLTLLALSAVG